LRRAELDKILGDLHGSTSHPGRTFRDDLETELLARYSRKYSRRRGLNMLLRNWWTRPVFAGLVVMSLGIAACSTPTSYDVELGQQMSITLPTMDKSFDGQIDEIMTYLDELPQTNEVLATIMETIDGPISLDVAVWGDDLDIVAITEELRRRFPVLETAVIENDPMLGSVETSLARRMEHEFFAKEPARESLIEISEEMSQELHLRGYSDVSELVMKQTKVGDDTLINLKIVDEEGELDLDITRKGDPQVEDRK